MCVPDKLVVIQEGRVFDQTEALLHSVDEGLDLQVGHLVQREEADASENIQQIAGLQVERLQILENTKYWGTAKRHRRKGLVYPPNKCLLTV